MYTCTRIFSIRIFNISYLKGLMDSVRIIFCLLGRVRGALGHRPVRGQLTHSLRSLNETNAKWTLYRRQLAGLVVQQSAAKSQKYVTFKLCHINRTLILYSVVSAHEGKYFGHVMYGVSPPGMMDGFIVMIVCG